MLEYGILMYAAGAVGVFTKRVINLRNGHAIFRQGLAGPTYNVFLNEISTTKDTVILNELIEEAVPNVSMYSNVRTVSDKFTCGTHESVTLIPGLSHVSLGKPKKQICITDDNKKLLENFNLSAPDSINKLRLDIFDPQTITVLSTDKSFFTADKGLTNKGPLYSSVMFNSYNRPQFMLTSIWFAVCFYPYF